MANRRARRLPSVSERLGEMDRTQLAIGVAGLLLLLAIFFPRVYPAAQHGIQCSDLSSPIGGNNRSVLAQAGGDQQNLDLELILESDEVQPGGNLSVRVTFINKDIGPIILYLPRNSLLEPYQPPSGPGVVFQSTLIGSGALLEDPFLAPVAGTYINPEELHLLGSRARCSEEFVLSANTINPAGLTPGSEYRLRAYYRNNNVGGQRPQVEGLLAPTATPAYFDQGVWVGLVSSDEKIFSVSIPGSP